MSGLDSEPRRGSNEEHYRKTHRILLETAAEAFWDSGFDIPIRKIVTRAGYSTGAFFDHFENKAGLAEKIIENAKAFWEEQMQSVVNVSEGGNRSPSEKTKALLKRDQRLFQASPFIKGSWALVIDTHILQVIKERFWMARVKFYHNTLKDCPTPAFFVLNSTNAIFLKATIMRNAQIADEIDNLIVRISELFPKPKVQ